MVVYVGPSGIITYTISVWMRLNEGSGILREQNRYTISQAPQYKFSILGPPPKPYNNY